MKNIQRYILTGIMTVIPIWLTWIVFEFILKNLSDVGLPWVNAASATLQEKVPMLSRWLLEPWFQSVLAVVLTLVALYILGWLASRVIGIRLIGLMDNILSRIPIVHTVYGSVRKLIKVLQSKPENIQRVVLIAFPSAQMKTVGFVTRVMSDAATGEKLAAVYVPTTPNPTSGYMEIVPVKDLISTDWSMDEAMTFILSAGAIAPEKINYSQGSTDNL